MLELKRVMTDWLSENLRSHVPRRVLGLGRVRGHKQVENGWGYRGALGIFCEYDAERDLAYW